MSKLGKKKVPTADSAYDGAPVPTAKTGQIGPDIPTANTIKSSDILKAHKVGAGKVPTANLDYEMEEKPKLEGEVEFGPTEVVSPKKKYSPIKNYLKGN